MSSGPKIAALGLYFQGLPSGAFPATTLCATMAESSTSHAHLFNVSSTIISPTSRIARFVFNLCALFFVRPPCHVQTPMPATWTPAGPLGARRLMLNKRFSRIAIAGLCSVVITILTFWSRIHGSYNISEYYPFATTSYFYPVSVDPTDKTTEQLCATFPKHLLRLIQPVLKMGHADSRERTDAQFDSVSACFGKDDLLVYSDLDETIRDHEVIDVIKDVPAVYYNDNPDFINYLWQKEMKANGTLDQDKEATARINGWRIDKFKFLPMIERAWRTRPDKDFYFFFETDTSVALPRSTPRGFLYQY